MDTIDIIVRSLERYFLELNEAEGRLRVLCPDGSAEVSGKFNVRKLARAGAAVMQETIDAEREACAALCDSFRSIGSNDDPYHRGIAVGSGATAAILADLIRARITVPAVVPHLQDHDNENFSLPLGIEGAAASGCPNTWWP